MHKMKKQKLKEPAWITLKAFMKETQQNLSEALNQLCKSLHTGRIRRQAIMHPMGI